MNAPCHSRLNRFLAPVAFLLLPVGGLSAQEENAYEAAIEQYGQRPVTMIQQRPGGNITEVNVIAVSPNGVVVRYPDIDGTVTLPVTEFKDPLTYRLQVEGDVYNRLVEEGRVAEALNLYRRDIYPLLKMVPLDPNIVQVHGHVGRFMQELLRQDRVLEVDSILEGFSRERITGIFEIVSLETVSRLSDLGEYQKAYDLVKRFPLGPGQTANARTYLDLADALRLNNQFEMARNLYKDVQLASSPAEFPEAFLWEAYIHLQEGRPSLAASALEGFGEVPATQWYFPLVQLVRGALAQTEGRNKDAILALAKGSVYTTTNDPWTPELLFRTAEAYEGVDMETAATEVRNQLTFFYPDSVWAKKL